MATMAMTISPNCQSSFVKQCCKTSNVEVPGGIREDRKNLAFARVERMRPCSIYRGCQSWDGRSVPARRAGAECGASRLFSARRPLRRVQDRYQAYHQRQVVSLHGSFIQSGLEYR